MYFLSPKTHHKAWSPCHTQAEPQLRTFGLLMSWPDVMGLFSVRGLSDPSSLAPAAVDVGFRAPTLVGGSAFGEEARFAVTSGG